MFWCSNDICMKKNTIILAKASCDQMQTLDSILEKELMLETLQVSNNNK